MSARRIKKPVVVIENEIEEYIGKKVIQCLVLLAVLLLVCVITLSIYLITIQGQITASENDAKNSPHENKSEDNIRLPQMSIPHIFMVAENNEATDVSLYEDISPSLGSWSLGLGVDTFHGFHHDRKFFLVLNSYSPLKTVDVTGEDKQPLSFRPNKSTTFFLHDHFGASVQVGSRFWIMGGFEPSLYDYYDDEIFFRQTEMLDVTHVWSIENSSWSVGPTLPPDAGRLGICATPLDRNRAILIGGIHVGFQDYEGPPGFAISVYIYDFANDSWELATNVPDYGGVFQSLCSVLFDKNSPRYLVLTGGFSGWEDKTGKTLILDLTQDEFKWTLGPDFPLNSFPFRGNFNQGLTNARNHLLLSGKMLQIQGSLYAIIQNEQSSVFQLRNDTWSQQETNSSSTLKKLMAFVYYN